MYTFPQLFPGSVELVKLGWDLGLVLSLSLSLSLSISKVYSNT